MERKGIVTMKGNPVTLVGPEIKVGDKAPDFTSLDQNMQPVKFSDMAGKVRLIASVVSLDTPVCIMETDRFNREADKLSPEKTAVLVISMDLPFALGRFCSMEGIKNVRAISDYREASFGSAYGVLIKENRLLARAIFVVDGGGIVRHVEYVKEVSSHPDYDTALNVVRDLIQSKAA